MLTVMDTGAVYAQNNYLQNVELIKDVLKTATTKFNILAKKQTGQNRRQAKLANPETEQEQGVVYLRYLRKGYYNAVLRELCAKCNRFQENPKTTVNKEQFRKNDPTG